MNASDGIEAFTALRPRLHSLAYQLLGNPADADDMVQECFLRWQRTAVEEVHSPKAFLTTVMTRLCLKHLQSARVQREHSFGELPEAFMSEQVFDPSDHARLSDSLSVALLVLLQSLSPVERAVFLLREVFEFDYAEIAGMIDRNEENCRQILRRARERVADRQSRFKVTPQHQDQILQHFLKASTSGEWNELMAVLAEDATLVRDGADVNQQAPPTVSGAGAVVSVLLQHAPEWFPAAATWQAIDFRGQPVALISKEATPITALIAGLRNDRVQNLCVITCPIRLKTLLVQDAARSFGAG